jgi:hypothetical protein
MVFTAAARVNFSWWKVTCSSCYHYCVIEVEEYVHFQQQRNKQKRRLGADPGQTKSQGGPALHATTTVPDPVNIVTKVLTHQPEEQIQ